MSLEWAIEFLINLAKSTVFESRIYEINTILADLGYTGDTITPQSDIGTILSEILFDLIDETELARSNKKTFRDFDVRKLDEIARIASNILDEISRLRLALRLDRRLTGQRRKWRNYP